MLETKRIELPRRKKSTHHAYRQMKHRQAERQYLRYKYQRRFHSLLIIVIILLSVAGVNGYQYLVSHLPTWASFKLPAVSWFSTAQQVTAQLPIEHASLSF